MRNPEVRNEAGGQVFPMPLVAKQHRRIFEAAASAPSAFWDVEAAGLTTQSDGGVDFRRSGPAVAGDA